MGKEDQMYGPFIEKAGHNEKGNEIIEIAGQRFHHIWKNPETQRVVARMMRRFFPMSDVRKIGDAWYSQELKFEDVEGNFSRAGIDADLDIYHVLFRDFDHYFSVEGLKNIRRRGRKYALFDLQIARQFWLQQATYKNMKYYRNLLAIATYKPEIAAKKANDMLVYYKTAEARKEAEAICKETRKSMSELFLNPPPGKDTFNDFYDEFLSRLIMIERLAHQAAEREKRKK